MPDSSTGAGRGRLLAAAIVVALVLVGGAFAIGRVTAPVVVLPTTTSADAGFARDMQVHHQQAVQMAMIIRDRTDDPAVRQLAYDIATTQAQQAGQMYGWLASWGLPQLGEPAMTWMTRPAPDGSEHGHSGDTPTHEPGAPMPGMATLDQLNELSELSGVEAERLFLELMIAHHQGGVEMAEGVLARTDTTVVRDLATSIVKAQESEIALMESMLAERQ
ncbi:DUF305 domain-containing protein [Antiquaquibacter oligotrophicus]|uniref:DUF305 domain-containing protein n=1 Tax=Antiquaquibacter oligotrophicus TaxID=2880260 RepID=UPI002AC900A3|nr:DUF305 domain-containing protein [Antiquaquibacter oligotrophicus]UDF12402.1 DUF305 domain-containing protein [Antiquaquibacter oligotrophicus]